MPKNDLLKLVLAEVQEVKKDVKELMTLKTEVEVLKTQVEERTGRRATIIASIGGLIAVTVSTAIAYLR